MGIIKAFSHRDSNSVRVGGEEDIKIAPSVGPCVRNEFSASIFDQSPIPNQSQ